ncbi:laminin subunit alpha-3-like [Platichthys flesus]|uniref:laminin subunit alpha-3-like n=1 Tax=Platichthys flesus TaxID=8260 RepID=UPI002DBE6303|nr:laminin subunit alpha-3-like [Platichthys flesus]
MARRMRGAHLLLVAVLTWSVTLFGDANGQESGNDVTGFSLSPPYFNIAKGSRISATATCGQDEAGRPRYDLYCKLVGGPNNDFPTQNIQGQFCDSCNSMDPNKAHPVTNAIDGTERWWQSPPLSRGLEYNEVNITLDLGQLFHVAYVLIKFANSPRPDLWVLERSVDYGRTYTPWQYFAHSKRECIEKFRKQPNARVVNDEDQVCTTEYSRTVPLENGEIVVSLVNGRPGSRNFTYSPVLRDFTKATNIRLHFLRTNTLLGHLISKAQRDPSVTRRYYYSVKDISIGGRCVCHGHAQVCGGGRNPDKPDRLQCDCKHNTCGESCDRCCPGFNQKPWRAATVSSPNECQPCNCFSHAFDCYYDPEVEKRGASLDTFARYDGGGVCIHCQHNTDGVNCERCIEGFYRPYGVPPESHDGCIPCRCDERTTAGCEMGSGRCICKPQLTGENCDRCADGHYNYPQCIRYPIYPVTTKSPAGPFVEPTVCPLGYFGSPYCQQCECDYRGTVPTVCDSSGRCLCREGVGGERCDRCQPGYHVYPNCQAGCRCDDRTSAGCEVGSGRCICKPQFAGENCDRCADGHYYYPQCSQCECDYRGTVSAVCDSSGRCLCREGVGGERCDRCQPGYHVYPNCQACRCDDRTSAGCEVGSGRCICKPQFAGENCDRCADGHYYYPQCSQCECDYRGTMPTVCDSFGRCLCREGVGGERCDRCQPGYHDYPNCQGCVCDGAGVADRVCTLGGQCVCLPNYVGLECDQCAPGYYGYPDCAACRCSPEGSLGNICNPVSGQCLCLPGVVGQQCDRCVSGLRFPQCAAPISRCNAAGTEVANPQTGHCLCLPNVKGTLCDMCKPLYWNLATENPRGCSECGCDLKGTLSGVGECEQKNGQCHCKPFACGHLCDTCKDGYFMQQKNNYFGCQGCQCDVGGAIGMACDETSGKCQCRKNIVGRKCTEPAPSYYFPSLHQLKFEVEDGTSPNARPVRFGYSPQEFPDFSWRGYAIMSPAQSDIRVAVHVDPREGRQHLFRVVLRFINPRNSSVTGSIRATDNRGPAGSDQSKEVIFPESRSPSFLTVPGEGFAEPFALTPGKWIIHIKAEGILLDYLVLLPREYYEAPLLQEKITEPCTYLPTADRNANCLLYKHVAMDGFSSALGSQGRLSSRSGRRRRQARVRRPTPDHPEMADLSGRQSQLQLSLRVPHSGPYALVLEYASEVDAVQNVNILIGGQLEGQIPARANIYSCAYSFLCRSVAVDSSNQVAALQLSHRTDLLLQISTASFLLYKVYAVPAEEFSIDYVDPKVLCVSTHSRFSEDSQHCVLRQFDKPTSAVILSAARVGLLSPPPVVAPQPEYDEESRRRRQTTVLPVQEPQGVGVLLKFPQTEISFSPEVPLPGRYVVVLHYHQPEHTSFPVEVWVDAGRDWRGSINASFCPAVSGCREVVIAEGRIALDLDQNIWRPTSISVIVPRRKTLTLDYILLVPDNSYSPDLLKEKPRDKSADFVQQCRGEGFYIDPRTSCQFCRDSARSLVAAYNDGALACDCEKSGSTGAACDPVGGQCPCRQHIIGRRCTKCATGYYGFPYCKPCECGRRLCDEVTGRCICPPQTVKPACDVCLRQTFNYHPLLGCEGCECSPNGIKANAGPDCERTTGQCSCKPRISGRKCDRCAPGYYRFPDCVPCNCNQGGVTPDVCHPDTGRCLCRRNVAGVRCDTCREGSFYFDPSNPHGCSSCFCFGATDQCQSSSKRRGKFVEMRGWHLERPDQGEVPSVLNTASNTVVADVQELPPTVQTLHWVAPQSYLGDRVTSYGGFLTYQSKSFGIPSEGMTLKDRRPDVVLTGRDMTLIHMATQVPLADRLYQGRVHLVEGNWRHAVTNRPVSREELMMVLAGLAGLRIQALYFTQSQRLSLGEVGFEEATSTGTGSPGNNVENCSCPPQYTGDSCEKCAPGFYRNNSGSLLGRCVPCECNGLADECEDTTGKCLKCQKNTAGDRCEHCQDGHYYAGGTCRVCPCPFSVATSSFAVGCREFFGDITCICISGYTGDKCERCAPGYYGNPLAPGGRCKPCNCRGDGGICDPRTGVCKNTLEPGDTNTHEKCQECDSCAQTLLHDLEKLDDELGRIKAKLDNASASASSRDKLKNLEKAVADTKNLVKEFNYAITAQKSRISQLEEDTSTLVDDVSGLKGKADKRSVEADKAVADVEKTHRRAKELDSEIKSMLKKIQALLDQLKDSGTDGSTVTNGNLGTMLEDAQRMVKEMEDRNFTPQATAAEKELDEAEKLLDHIRVNVTKQSDQNEAAAKKLRGQLEGYDAKLKDLDKALKEATDLVKKANAENGLSAKALAELQKRIENLKKERKTVEEQMALAEDELQKTVDLVKTLTDSKTEYEQLAAQLDGAKTDLTKRVNDISKAAAQEDIVERAEEHAKNLLKMAKELQDSVKNASGRTEVQDAKNAIDAYKNITDAINAAEAAAKEAKDAADKALKNVNSENLNKRAEELKESGEDLVQDAREAEENLQDATKHIADLKKRLKDADNKKKTLKTDLLDAADQLNNIKRDDIGTMIDEAKEKAASANDKASDTMDKLAAIQKEIDKISVTPVDSNLGNILENVDKTVKELLNTIPSLTNKISEVENLTSNLSSIGNISLNIKMIKELIEQARDAANKISIPMNFNGNGHVELRPPSNLEDLRAYTSLSLSLARPKGRGDGRRRRRQTKEEDMFVLYLGNRDSSKDYIGMVLKKNVLHSVYKLNGVEYEMTSGYISKSDPEPATFDKVDLHRIYQDAQIVLTKDITSPTPDEPILSSNQGVEKKNLLDLSRSDVVFYVGGYPADFTPPASLNHPKYEGCIEFSSFNDKVISLYNFQKAENINQKIPCKRYVPPKDSYFFEGTGYGKLFIDKASNNLLIRMSAFARSENGLLLYIGSEDKYFTVTLEKGLICINSNLLQEPVRSTDRLFPSSDYVDILIIINNRGQFLIRANNVQVAMATAEFTNSEFKEYYIGGLVQDLREKHNITIQPFTGCMSNLKQNNDFKPIDEQVGVSKGCPKDSLSSRKAEFHMGSSLSANLPGFTLDNDLTVSLGFKSTENQGLILQDKKLPNGIKLALLNGHVVLSFNDEMLKSNRQYNDGQWHYLTVRRKDGRNELYVDDDDEGQTLSGSTPIPNTDGTLVLGNKLYKGCISNLYTRRPENLYKAEDFSPFVSSGDVLVDVCTSDTPAQMMLDRIPKKDGVMQPINYSGSACALPAQVPHAYRMGGPVSSLSYNLPLPVQLSRAHFSLDVRTESSEGLLFFAATKGGRSHLALYMSKGRIRLSAGTEKKIFNRENYDDGKWHSIVFSLEKKKFRLVVNGIRAQDGQLTNTELTSMQQFVYHLYLGSVPESLHKQLQLKFLPKQSVSGCIRGFRMNGVLMSKPASNLGAGPCFKGPTQRGAYFSGNGAHVLINDSIAVGSNFELLFNIRPRSLTGLLLHVGDLTRTQSGAGLNPYLSIYLLRGEVVVQVNNGNGNFMVSVKPKASLCDGMFHKVSVIKRKNVVQLHVDTVDNYKIGPPFSTVPQTKAPLYVGGVPGTPTQQTPPLTSSFVGCIQDMRINEDPVSFERLPAAFGPVNLKECPG